MFYSSGSLADESLATRCRSSNPSFLEQTTLGLLAMGLLDLDRLARRLAMPLLRRALGQSNPGRSNPGQQPAKHRFHLGR